MPTGQFELNKQTLSVIKEIGGDIPGGFFIYRREEPGEVLYANKALYTIYGCRDQDEFRELTGGTFKGMVHPEDYENVVKSAEAQVQANEDRTDHVEFRFFRKDGEIRFAGDHGRYTETGNIGGFYTAFISDITQEREQRENDTAVRDAVIAALTNTYNTVWLINDVVTESCSLYHTDMDEAHAEAIRNALSHARYTDTKAEYVATMVAEEDQERMQEQISLPYILKQFETKDQFSVFFIRALASGRRYYRIDFGKVKMPGGRTGVTMGFKDVEESVRRKLAMQTALEDAKRTGEEKLALQGQLREKEKLQKELDSMITAMASDYRSVYHIDLDTDDAVCYRADENDPYQTPEGVHFPYHARFINYCEQYVDEEYKKGFLQFIDPDYVRETLTNESIMAYRYLARRDGREY